MMPVRDTGKVHWPAAPPAHPSDIWSLWPWCPAAVNAFYRDSPILIVWHFQLRG
jgi:hypothetical protein